MWPFSSAAPKIYTGRVLSLSDMRAALGPIADAAAFGKQQYAEVSSKAVIWLAQQDRNELFSDGITQWAADATCTLYGAEFTTKANRLFFGQAFQDPISTKILALAAGEIWFHPDTAPFLTNHSIGMCVTEAGVLFVDPQVPDALRVMSDTERASPTAGTRFL